VQSVPELLKQIEEALEALQFTGRQPVNLYEPIRYVLSLGGKRIRPLLTLLSYQAVTTEPVSRCMDTALAIELFHNFSLVHDDIMDNAETRRGAPALHVKWNQNTAILAGDALFAYTMGLMTRNFPERAAALIETYARIALEVCEGQMQDLDQSGQQQVTDLEYIEMIRKKTAVLLGGALRVGALAAGAPPDLCERVDALGQTLGIAFQIQDDVYDAFPPDESFGKKIGGDILENKNTLLRIIAGQRATPAQRQILDTWFARPEPSDEKVQHVLAVYRETGVQEYAHQQINNYSEQARLQVTELMAYPGYQIVWQLWQELMNRKS
jgi:geranylgeranyl diphosphate synthase type II